MGSGAKIISHSSIYLLGSILQRGVSFIMLPIYTRFLTPADYGIIELLTLAVDLVGLIFGLRIAQAIFRYYSIYQGKARDRVVTTALFLVAGCSSVGVALLVTLSGPVAGLTFADPALAGLLSLFALTLLGQGLIEVPMIGLKAAQRPVLFVSFSLGKLLLQLGLNIYFVVLLEMRVEGVVYSTLIATAVMALVLCGYTLATRGIGFSRAQARELIAFSLPLVLTDLLSFYLTFGDRYFLRAHFGLAEVGLYSLAYKFGFLLAFLIMTPFGNIWDTEKYAIAKAPDFRERFREVFILYSCALIAAATIMSLYIRDFLTIMAAPEFRDAYRVVPVILAAYVVNAWASFCNLGIYLQKKTGEIFYGTLLAVGVISIGYVGLIPRFGSLGAAWATFGAFAARTAWIYFRSRRLFDMGLQWRSIVYLLCLWGVVQFLAQLAPEPLGYSILYKAGVLLLLGATLVVLPVIPRPLKQKIRLFAGEKLAVLRPQRLTQPEN